jgi:hypothetical protein
MLGMTVPADCQQFLLARAGSIYRRQTRPLVREDAPQKQDLTIKEQ